MCARGGYCETETGQKSDALRYSKKREAPQREAPNVLQPSVLCDPTREATTRSAHCSTDVTTRVGLWSVRCCVPLPPVLPWSKSSFTVSRDNNVQCQIPNKFLDNSHQDDVIFHIPATSSWRNR
ncbi:unnamed protein product, partial [Ectocarpus sp. 12 AP-2014]